MLKELANKVEELVKGQVQPEIVVEDGCKYVKTSRGYEPFEKSRIQTVELNTLTGLVKMIDAIIDNDNKETFNTPLLVRVDGNDINVFTTLNKSNRRETLVRVSPKTPRIPFNSYISVEDMIIKLTTVFEETANSLGLVKTISNMRQVSEVTFNDDGISQQITATNGVITEKFELPPILKLMPIRTYAELEQIESKFRIRVDKNAYVALYEADGGQWEYEAQQSIVEYLSKDLKQEIEKGNVKIIG